MDSELEVTKDEARRRQEALSRDLDDAIALQRSLESANSRLVDKAADIKKLLQGKLDLSDDEYVYLRSRQDSELSVRDYVQLRLHETMRPVLQELREYRLRCQVSEKESGMSTEEAGRLATALEEERELHRAVQENYAKVLIELADTRALVVHGNYKIENYDKCAEDRDMAQTTLETTRQRLLSMEASHYALTAERDDLARESAAQKQTIDLLRQDKDYLTRQVAELGNRVSHSEERLQLAIRQVDEAKESRERLFEKMTRQADESRSAYESRLAEEVDGVRRRAEAELERLRAQSREVTAQELRALRDARDAAAAERDRALLVARTAEETADAAREEMITLRGSVENRLTELNAEVKLKSWESERAALALSETATRLREAQLESERQASKANAAASEAAKSEADATRRLAELESRCTEQERRLQSYDAAEHELDQVVLQAAEVEDSSGNGVEAERLVQAYGQGAALPATARRRMLQAVELARRVLQLERRVRELATELETVNIERDDARDELKRLEEQLSTAQQPYSYLVDTLRTKDDALRASRKKVGELEADGKSLRKKCRELARGKNALAADLERLLNQREEMGMMRKLVTRMQMENEGVEITKEQPLKDRNDSIVFEKKASRRQTYGVSYS